ncbi:MAG: tetratricopeptide repeat protein, partial [Synechococcus lacustris]|nr:tetratricopeptide repeat protein [Synechococcus lacustris]
LLQMGQVDEGRKLARLAVQVLPNDPRAWLVLAEAELRSSRKGEKNNKAYEALARAKQLDPNNPGVWFAEGSLNLRNNKPEEAQKLLREGLRLDPNNPGAYFDLGNAQIQLKELNPALASFEKAAGLRKGFWEAVNNQAIVLFEQGRTAEAVGRWRKALEISSDAAEPSLALAAALYSEGKTSTDTITLATQALVKEPDYVLDAYQKDQLWGAKLRQATQVLFRDERLRGSVDRAMGMAGFKDE